MQLNSSTDYALKIILYLAQHLHVVSSKKLSEAIQVSPRYLLQIGAKLREAELVTVSHGASGGYKLARSIEQITLFEVIFLMEGNIQSHQDTRNFSDTNGFFALEMVYKSIDHIMKQYLKNITIKKLLTKPNQSLHSKWFRKK